MQSAILCASTYAQYILHTCARLYFHLVTRHQNTVPPHMCMTLLSFGHAAPEHRPSTRVRLYFHLVTRNQNTVPPHMCMTLLSFGHAVPEHRPSTHVHDSTFIWTRGTRTPSQSAPTLSKRSSTKRVAVLQICLYLHIYLVLVDSRRTLRAPPRYGCYVVVCNPNIWLSNCRLPWRQCTHIACSYRNVEVY